MISGNKIFFMAFGVFVLFLGWFNVITGALGLSGAQDINVIFQVENVFVVDTISASSIMFHMIIRILLGFFLVLIGNSFLLRSQCPEGVCHPRMGDLEERIVRRFKKY